MTNNDYIDIKNASDYLGVSIRTIQRYIKGKRIKSRHINGKTIIYKPSMEELKSNLEVIKSTHEKPAEAPTQNPLPGQSLEMVLVKDSLDILRDQLRAKDDQIKELSVNVRELQTTQKLLIEKGLNLTQPASQNLSLPTTNEEPLNQTSPKVESDKGIFNIEINKNAEPAIIPFKTDQKPAAPGNANKYFVIAILASLLTILLIAIVFYLIK